MDEQSILAALIADRSSYDRLAGRLDANDFSEYGQLILKTAVQFYGRDPEAKLADRETLRAGISRQFPSEKQARTVLDYLDTIPESVSIENVVTEYRLLRRRRIGLELAATLGGRDPDDERVEKLMDKYRELSMEQRGEKMRPSLDELAARSGQRIALHPTALNDYINGGLLRGDHVVVFGRPNAAKTMFAIDNAASMVQQGYKVLYICNEESSARLYARFLSRLSRGQYAWTPIESEPGTVGAAAEQVALQQGLERLHLIHEPSGKLGAMEALVRTVEPDVLFVDQMRNLKSSASNRVLELEEVAREIRRMAGTYGLAALSMTQAGDSAEDKLNLTMGDVDWSNTAIQAACDLLIGIGSDANYRANNRRMVNLLKNKLGPRDARLVLFLEPAHNIYRSKPRRKANGK